MRAWAGHRLGEIDGDGVGKVEGLFVDEQTGKPEWVLARTGRFGHHALVPARDAVEGVGRVWVPYTRDQIQGAPKVSPGKPLGRDTERELLEHYGIAADARRFAELDKRPADAVTAKPA
jgi:PRC-barrel domain